MNEVWPAKRRGCTTCYLFAVGATIEPWRLTALLEEQMRDDVDVANAPEGIIAAFPATDAVRVVTRRNCSCDLIEAGPWLTPVSRTRVALKFALRGTLARGVSQLRAVRVYVSSGVAPQPYALRRLLPPLVEFSSVANNFPLDSLVELTHRPPGLS